MSLPFGSDLAWRLDHYIARADATLRQREPETGATFDEDELRERRKAEDDVHEDLGRAEEVGSVEPPRDKRWFVTRTQLAIVPTKRARWRTRRGVVRRTSCTSGTRFWRGRANSRLLVERLLCVDAVSGLAGRAWGACGVACRERSCRIRH